MFNDQDLCFPPTTYSFPPNLLLQSPLPYSTFTAHFRAVSHLIYATPPAPTPHLRSSSWLTLCFIVKSLQGPDRSITALPHHSAGEESESHEVGTGHGARVATLRLASDSRSSACTRPTPGVPEAVLGQTVPWGGQISCPSLHRKGALVKSFKIHFSKPFFSSIYNTPSVFRLKL